MALSKLLICIGVLVVCGATFLMVFERDANTITLDTKESALLVAPKHKTEIVDESVTVENATYTNKEFGFSLSLPNTMHIKEFSEQGGAKTIVFQNIELQKGFQMFILPYYESTITQERFTQDVPSGIREHEKEIIIDGVSGVSFYSHNTFIGETAEVWFIHNNYLFEITTHKIMAPLIEEVMKSWKFQECCIQEAGV